MAHSYDHAGYDDSDIFASVREAAQRYEDQTNTLSFDPYSVIPLELIWHDVTENTNVDTNTLDANPVGADIIATYDTSHSSSDDQVVEHAEGASAFVPSPSPPALLPLDPPGAGQDDPFGLMMTVGGSCVANPGERLCLICKRLFKKRTKLEEHEKTHEDATPFRCNGECGEPNCQKAYQTADGLKVHCLPKQERDLECPYCQKKIRRQNITRHMKKSCLKKRAAP